MWSRLQVSVSNCKLSMVPSEQVDKASKCPCFWFNVRFAGDVSAPGRATIALQEPLPTVAAARQLVSWASANSQAYSS